MFSQVSGLAAEEGAAKSTGEGAAEWTMGAAKSTGEGAAKWTMGARRW